MRPAAVCSFDECSASKSFRGFTSYTISAGAPVADVPARLPDGERPDVSIPLPAPAAPLFAPPPLRGAWQACSARRPLPDTGRPRTKRDIFAASGAAEASVSARGGDAPELADLYYHLHVARPHSYRQLLVALRACPDSVRLLALAALLEPGRLPRATLQKARRAPHWHQRPTDAPTLWDERLYYAWVERASGCPNSQRRWCSRQRRLHYFGLLAPDRAWLLSRVPGWRWAHTERPLLERQARVWTDNLERAARYVARHGRAPPKRLPGIGRWFCDQLSALRQGSMRVERIDAFAAAVSLNLSEQVFTGAPASEDEEAEGDFNAGSARIGERAAAPPSRR